MRDLFTDAGATFSDNGKYRFTLWRKWDDSLPIVNFIMLNPSTADEATNDPTIERCERRARAGGYGGLVVTNLFALRSTDPDALYHSTDPVGPGNDAVILREAQAANLVVCAWGAHGAFMNRGLAVSSMLVTQGVSLYAFIFTAKGEPGHPLYLSYEDAPFLWMEGRPEVLS